MEKTILLAPAAAEGAAPAGDDSQRKAGYWARRSDMLYYQYVRYIVRCVGAEARSMVDVGSHQSPYLEWFDWIPEKVSVDLKDPYSSETVRGVEGSIHDLRFPQQFDLLTCLQVLEHVPEPEPFARRLLDLARLLIVSVPYKWPKGHSKTHVNDPVDRQKLAGWFGRAPNYQILVREPFVRKTGGRLIALYDADPKRRFGTRLRKARRPA